MSEKDVGDVEPSERERRALDLLELRLDASEDSGKPDSSPTGAGFDADLVDEAALLERRLSRISEVLEAPMRVEAPRFVTLGLNLRVLRRLGQGGQGSVYLAADESLKREVALKLANWRDESSALRLRKEAEIASRLNHPGIVPIFGAGSTELGIPFLVMRFVEGRTLHQLLTERRESDDFDAEAVARAALGALSATCRTTAYAHDRGVSHGDLKPRNILLGAQGETALLDWGLSAPFSEGAKPPGALEVTASSALRGLLVQCGTAAFMSPERVAGDETVGTWGDVYSLGAVVDRLVFGSPSPPSTSSADASERERDEAYPGLPLAPKTKSRLRRLSDRACETEPAKRPESAHRIADELDAILEAGGLAVASRRSSVFDLFRPMRSWRF